jgi:hypothetical protein
MTCQAAHVAPLVLPSIMKSLVYKLESRHLDDVRLLRRWAVTRFQEGEIFLHREDYKTGCISFRGDRSSGVLSSHVRLAAGALVAGPRVPSSSCVKSGKREVACLKRAPKAAGGDPVLVIVPEEGRGQQLRVRQGGRDS